MTIRDYILVLRQRLWLFVAVVVATVVVAVGIFLIVPATYTSEVSFYVVSRLDDAPSQAFQAAQLNQQRTTSYAELATDPRIITDVAARLDPPTTPERLLRQVSASTRSNSLLVVVTATDTDPVQAARIADLIAEDLTRLVDQVERPLEPGQRPAFTARIVAPALVPPLPSSIGLVGVIAIGMAAGVLLGFVVVLARHLKQTNR